MNQYVITVPSADMVTCEYYIVCECGWASGAMGEIPTLKTCYACAEREESARHIAMEANAGAERFRKLAALLQVRGGWSSMPAENPTPARLKRARMMLVVRAVGRA